MRADLTWFSANVGTTAVGTFIPIFAAYELGIADPLIGVAVTLYALSLFFSSYMFGRWSDIQGLRRFILGGLVLTAVAMLAHLLIFDVWTLWAVRILAGVAVGVYPAALVDYITRSSKRLGRFSAWGSLGWGMGAFAASVVAQAFGGLALVFVMGSAIMLGSLAVALTLRPVPEVHHKVPLFPKALIRRNMHIYVPMLLRHSGATGIWVFWVLFLFELGADYLWVGIIQLVNPVAQFVFMYTFTDKVRTRLLFPVGLALSVAVMLSFTLAQNVWQLLPTQVLLGAAWSCTYVGALRTVTDTAEEKATASGLLTSVTSVSQVIGPAMATLLVTVVHDYRAEMYLGAAMSAAALVAHYALRRSAEAPAPVTAAT